MIFDEANFPDLPESWTSLLVEDACDNISIKQKTKTDKYLATGRLAVVDQGAKLIGGYINDTDESVTADLPVIIFGDHTRAIKYIDFPFAAGADGIKVLKPKEFYEPKLFYQFLRAIRLPNKGYARHFQFLRSSKIALPPLNEQKRIAEKIDTLLARVDSCQTHLERVPQILKRFRQSVLAAATSGRLTEDLRGEKGDNDKQETSSDEIPAGWYWAPISELVTNHDNKRIPIRLQDRAKRRGKYPYYGAFGIIDSIDEFLYDGEYLLVAEDGKNLEKRDRPIALIASGQFWVNNHAHVLQTLDNLLLKYLCFWFNSPTLDLADYLTGIDQVKLTRGALDRISVPVPPLEEQAEIVRRVEKLFAYAERLEARYTSASEHVERLTPSLLAKAFRGELVGQEA